MHQKNKIFLILLIIRVSFTYGQNKNVIQYDFLDGVIIVKDINYTGEVVVKETIDNKEFLNCSVELKNGKLHGRVEKNTWLSPLRNSLVPAYKEILFYFEGKLHGDYFKYESFNDTLQLIERGKNLNGIKDGYFLSYYKNKVELIKVYEKGYLKSESSYDINGFLLYRKQYLSDSLLTFDATCDEQEFNYVVLTIKNMNLVQLAFFRNDTLKQSIETKFLFKEFPWLLKNSYLFMIELDFLKAYNSPLYFPEKISSYINRKVPQ